MDLPTEIRYMIYKLLLDRRVRVRVPKVKISRSIISRTEHCVDCYCPEMMRVNKQMKDEYTTLVMPRLMLRVNWVIRENHACFLECMKPALLPARIFSQLRLLDLGIHEFSPHPGKLL